MPSSDELSAFYSHERLDPIWDREVLASTWPLDFYRKRLDAITRYTPCERVLDYGAGFGHFLLACKERCTVEGIDLGAPVADYIRRQHGISIAVGAIEGRYAADEFDCVHIKDVIEHLPDPIASLLECKRILRPGGIVVIETLNIDSLFARLAGRRYPGYIPGHVVYFSPRTLQTAAQLTGLKLVKIWAGDEIHWTAYFKALPVRRAMARTGKKVRIGSLLAGSMVAYLQKPPITAAAAAC